MSLTLAHTYRPEKDEVTGWWVQPKLDGVRAVFDGEKLVSRTGKEFHPPSWWVEDLAKYQRWIGYPLDGELICIKQVEAHIGEYPNAKLESFNDVVSTVRRKSPDDRWNEVILAVFDYITDEPTPYRERYERLAVSLMCSYSTRMDTETPSFLIPVEGVMEGDEAMEDGWLLEAKVRGWEGIMLRNPDAPYEKKRTSNLLKVKPVRDDEFAVVAVQPGTGKHEGRMGALVCKRGRETFKVGTGFTDADREQADWVGKTITVEYFELTPRGVPRHPRFKGVRDYE